MQQPKPLIIKLTTASTKRKPSPLKQRIGRHSKTNPRMLFHVPLSPFGPFGNGGIRYPKEPNMQKNIDDRNTKKDNAVCNGYLDHHAGHTSRN